MLYASAAGGAVRRSIALSTSTAALLTLNPHRGHAVSEKPEHMSVLQKQRWANQYPALRADCACSWRRSDDRGRSPLLSPDASSSCGSGRRRAADISSDADWEIRPPPQGKQVTQRVCVASKGLRKRGRSSLSASL